MSYAGFSYIPSGKAIEFVHSERSLPSGIVADNFLAVPMEEVPEDAETLVIDGQKQQVGTHIVRALGATVRLTHEMQVNNTRVDCNVFAVMLCDGMVAVTDKLTYHSSRKMLSFGVIAETKDLSKVSRLLEPLQLAEANDLSEGERYVLPWHMVVPLATEGQLVAHKYGDFDIAVGNVQSATQLYATTHVASVLSVNFTVGAGEPIVDYQAPGSETAERTYTYDSAD